MSGLFNSFDENLLNIFPEDIMVNNLIVPFNITKEYIEILASENLSENLINQLKFLSGKKPLIKIESKKVIKSFLNSKLCTKNIENAINSISLDNSTLKEESSNYESSPIVKFVNYLIMHAINNGTSDIHIEPNEKNIAVRLRIDGVLRKFLDFPIKIHNYVIGRIKVMANMNITEKYLPQDGKIFFNFKDEKYDLRVSTLPTIYGEKVVIRILYKPKEYLSFENLGFSENSIKLIKEMLELPSGLILITGPTGSGKSTTLYSMIKSLNSEGKNIITIEEPVEYSILGVNQVNVNNNIGLTFSEGLKNILRQDPDIIMIGEIRDEETAQIAARAAITGHLVLATLHTNNATDSITRLIDMGVPKYLLSDALIGIIAQRLVRKICDKCKKYYKTSLLERTKLGIKNNLIFKGAGCSYCDDFGYNGRTVTYEIVKLTDKHKNVIQSCSTSEEFREFCINEGMITLNENLKSLVLKGKTTIEEYKKISSK